jgi:hypothetical protein
VSAAANRVFISYRRDDAAGYAGRLEEALEQRLGHGSVFRDVLDIAPGEDFVAAIRARLAGAHTVLVLIGPRWAGEAAGGRRIDDPNDFVRLEVATALDSGVRVVPVLLPGATAPAEHSLPAPLQALARRNAMTLGDAHWNADVERLVALIGVPHRHGRRAWLWAGAALASAALVGLLLWWSGRPADLAERVVGTWAAEVRYGWGDRYTEKFEFKRHAGQLTGTASFLRYPRAIDKLQLDGLNLRFQTRSISTMGDVSKEVTRSYAGELRGRPPDETLVLRMESAGGFSTDPPIEFEARRVATAASAPR